MRTRFLRNCVDRLRKHIVLVAHSQRAQITVKHLLLIYF